MVILPMASAFALDAAIGECGGKFCIFVPALAVSGDRQWQKNVHQHFCHSRIADQRHAFRRALRTDGVVMVPVFVAQIGEEAADRVDIAALAQIANFRPVPNDFGQRGDAPLGMIRRALAAHPPKRGREIEPLEVCSLRPPSLPGLAEIGARR